MFAHIFSGESVTITSFQLIDTVHSHWHKLWKAMNLLFYLENDNANTCK